MFDGLKNLLRAPETKDVAHRAAHPVRERRPGALDAARLRGAGPRGLCLQRDRASRSEARRRECRRRAHSSSTRARCSATAHPLLDLLARPNPRQEGAAFLEGVCAHLLLAGNAYIEAVSVEGAVRELYALRPDRVRVVPGADGWPEAYDYAIGARSVRFDQSTPLPPILHLDAIPSARRSLWAEPLEAAAVAVELSLVECPAFALTLLHALWIGHDTGINGFASLSALFMAYFGARFGVLGFMSPAARGKSRPVRPASCRRPWSARCSRRSTNKKK